MAKIYDLFMYGGYDEDLLEIRLNCLWDVVDCFFLAESQYSHSGHPKPLYFLDNFKRFEKYKEKLRFISVPYMQSDNPWDFEMGTRQYLYESINNKFSDEDILILGDLDEIPRLELVKDLVKNLNNPTTFLSDYFYFMLDLWGRYPSPDSVLVKAGWINQPIWRYRQERWKENGCVFTLIDKGGWHFSSVGTLENICKKMQYFAHSRETEKDLINLEWIKECIKLKKGSISRGAKPDELKCIPITSEYLPEYIVKNREKYKELFYE